MDSFSSYHPAINFLYFTVVLLVTMFMMQPVFLAISCVCAYAYSIYLKGKKALKFNFLYMLPVLLIAALTVCFFMRPVCVAVRPEGYAIASPKPQLGLQLELEALIREEEQR